MEPIPQFNKEYTFFDGKTLRYEPQSNMPYMVYDHSNHKYQYIDPNSPDASFKNQNKQKKTVRHLTCIHATKWLRKSKYAWTPGQHTVSNEKIHNKTKNMLKYIDDIYE